MNRRKRREIFIAEYSRHRKVLDTLNARLRIAPSWQKLQCLVGAGRHRQEILPGRMIVSIFH